MAQRRFSRFLVAGLITGYVGLVFIVVSILTGSWFTILVKYSGNIVITREKMVGLFNHDDGAAKTCQAFMILSFLTNVIGCVLGMASSYAVTRPRVAGMAVKKLRMKPKKLTLGPKCAGFCYLATGILLMIAAAVASARFKTGYSVILAWIAFVTCIVSAASLIWAQPPAVPHIPDPGMLEAGTRGKIFKRRDKEEETLPREIARAETLAFREENERNEKHDHDSDIIAPNNNTESEEKNAEERDEKLEENPNALTEDEAIASE